MHACLLPTLRNERVSWWAAEETMDTYLSSLVADEGEMMIGYGRRKATQKKHCYLSPEETLKSD